MAYNSDNQSRSQQGSMTDGYLCTLIEQEKAQGIGFNDVLQSDRQKAMQLYLGYPEGELAPPEVEGRSRVVSKDVMDTVEWCMPSMMEEFSATDDVIRFEPSGPADEQNCQDATRYCGYLLHRKNAGFVVLHDAIKSALITRMGVIKVYCDRSWTTREETLTNQSDMDLAAIKGDDDIEIVEVTAEIPVQGGQPVMVAPGQFGPPQPTYTVRVKIKERNDQFLVEGVPPEEIIMSKDSRDIEKLRFISHEVERSRSDLISLGYPRDKVDALYDNKRANSASESWTRSEYDGVDMYNDNPADYSQEKVTVSEVHMLVDYDGDGVSEYRRIVKSGRQIFENEVVETHPFALFTPFLMPYKLIGLSLADLVSDIMIIKSTLARQMLDNQYLANAPRTVVVAGQVNMDDFLNPVPGGAIRATSPNALQELTVSNIAPQALAAIEYFTGVRDSRSGIKEFSQGLIGNEISQSQIGSQGVSQLMDAAATRIKLMARVFAETGIKRVYQLLLKLVTQYQDREDQVKVNGHWMQVDPRAWRNNYDMVISVGIGSASKQQRMATAMQMLQVQAQAAPMGMVQPQNGYNALQDFTMALGKSDVSRYFSMPQPQPPQPSESDKQFQLEQFKAQSASQLQAQKHQLDAQGEVVKQQAQAAQQQHEKELEAQRNMLQMQQDERLATVKAQLDAELARYKADLQHQTAIEVARINAEAKIAAAKALGAKDASTADADVSYQEAHEGDLA